MLLFELLSTFSTALQFGVADRLLCAVTSTGRPNTYNLYVKRWGVVNGLSNTYKIYNGTEKRDLGSLATR